MDHPSTSPGETRDLRVWLLALGYLAVSATLFFAVGFRVSIVHAVTMYGVTLAAAVIAIAAIGIMPGRPLVHVFSTFSQHAVYGLASAMLSYAAACTQQPLADAAALSIDRWLGYSWYDYLALNAAHPTFSQFLLFAYNSLFWQMAIIIIVCGFRRAGPACAFWSSPTSSP